MASEKTEKWFVHVVGSDDVIEQPDELTALRVANATNAEHERQRRNDPSPLWPFMMAIVRKAGSPELGGAGKQ